MGTSISPAKSTSLVPNSSASPEATRLMPPPPPREPLFPILLDDDEEEEEDPEDRWLPEDEFLNLNPDSLPLPEFIDPGMLSLDNPEVEKPATARPPATASVELVTTWLESNPSLFDSIISYNPGPTPPLTPGTTPTPSFSSIQLGSSSHQQQQQSGLTQPTSTQCGDPQLDRLITAKLLTASVSRQLGNYTESTSGPRPAPHQQSPDAFTCLTLLPTLTLGSDNTLHITTLTECSKPLQSPAQVLSHFIVSHPKVADKYGIRPQWNGVSELLKRGVVGMTGRWFGCKVVCAEGGEGSRDEDGVEQRDGRVCGRRGMGLGELERHLCLEHEGLARRFGVGAFEGCQDDVGLI